MPPPPIHGVAARRYFFRYAALGTATGVDYCARRLAADAGDAGLTFTMLGAADAARPAASTGREGASILDFGIISPTPARRYAEFSSPPRRLSVGVPRWY